MARGTTTGEYQALAEFRFLMRRFLNNGEKAARAVGLEPQQYMALLALRGLPADQEPTIRNLAERLQILHHSAVELVDRMQSGGLFRRERSKGDRRRVLLHVTARGQRLLNRLVHTVSLSCAPPVRRSRSRWRRPFPTCPSSPKRRASTAKTKPKPKP